MPELRTGVRRSGTPVSRPLSLASLTRAYVYRGADSLESPAQICKRLQAEIRERRERAEDGRE